MISFSDKKFLFIAFIEIFDKNLFKQGKFSELVYSKMQPIIGNGKNFRNVTFKENVVIAFFNILNSNKTNNKIYWVGDKNYKITINQLFKKICHINKMPFENMKDFITQSKTWNPNIDSKLRDHYLNKWNKAISKAKHWT